MLYDQVIAEKCHWFTKYILSYVIFLLYYVIDNGNNSDGINENINFCYYVTYDKKNVNISNENFIFVDFLIISKLIENNLKDSKIWIFENDCENSFVEILKIYIQHFQIILNNIPIKYNPKIK